MSVIDILFRVDEICKKYDKYDIDKQGEQNAFGDDAFATPPSSLRWKKPFDNISYELQKAEKAETETNRAASVAMNAEIRRTKARLLEEIPKLQKLALKKVKGLLKEDLEARSDLVVALPERIRAIPDGARNTTTQGSWGTSTSRNHIKFDTTADGNFDSEFFKQSEESSQFRQEYEMRRMKQDEGLDIISSGLDTLKELAHDMNEELDRQVPLMDEIDTKVDRATADLKNTNVRLKETLFKVRSTRNFIIDIILLCVLLGIVMYLYNVLKE